MGSSQLVIKELKQRRLRHQRERQKQQLYLHVHHAFLYIPPSLHDYDVKIPYFTFCGGREPARQRLSSSFSELRYSLLEFNSRNKNAKF